MSRLDRVDPSRHGRGHSIAPPKLTGLRRAPWWVAVSVAGITLLLLCWTAPFASAHPTVILRAPFHHATTFLDRFAFSSGCHAAGTFPSNATLNLSTGQVAGWTRAIARDCGNGSSWAEAYVGLEFTGFLLRASTATPITIAIEWSAAWAGQATVVGGTSLATGHATWLVYIQSFVDDNNSTTGRTVSSANLNLGGAGYIFNGTSASNGRGTFWNNMSFTPVAGHVYDISSLLGVDAYAQSDATGVFASAGANVAGPGYGGRLVSVTIS